MILGIGIDYVDVGRMAALLEAHPERAPRRLFTEAERGRCAGRPSPAECYAARFAAKEAFLKALGRGVPAGIPWHDMEVVPDERGNPELTLRGRARELARAGGAVRCHLTMSHDGNAAVAVVILEGEAG